MRVHDIIVLKFGSSILADSKHITQAIHEAYKYLRKGQKVLAVVSALGSTTDDLLTASQSVLNDPLAEADPTHLAELLATGEITATALFALALDNAGIPVAKLDHQALQLEGPLLDGTPAGLDHDRIHHLFDHHAVVVLPGFIGKNAHGQLGLLGRGGSDFTAIFAAWSLKAKACVLYKDTAGIYDRDPNLFIDARRYQNIQYQDALRLEYPVVQFKALHFAEEKQFTFVVRAIDATTGTSIGPEVSAFAKNALSAPKLRVTMIGLGTVGLGVYKHLTDAHSGFEVVGVAVKNLHKNRHHNLPQGVLTDNLDELLQQECDVVIELMGGIELAREVIITALKKGRHVITANKALLAEVGAELNELAAAHGVKLLFSASVAGAIPLLEKIEVLKAQNRQIKSVSGILNGTCNFVLDQVRAGASLAEAIKQAQEAGFAEADPSLDINGTDAAQKLKIISRLAFGVDPYQFTVEGIENINEVSVRDTNTVVRLIGHCELRDNVVYASLKPTILALDHPLAAVKSSNNCALIETEEGTIKLQGKGAGRWPTAVSVYADLLDLKHSIGA